MPFTTWKHTGTETEKNIYYEVWWFQYNTLLHIPNGCFDAYEVNKDICKYQEKVKLIYQFQRFLKFSMAY